MSVSQLRLWPSILCSTPSVFRAVHCRWISPGWRFTLFPTTVSLALQACPKELSKTNRAIWRCWKVDGFLFHWPSFPHSSSRRQLLMIPVVPVYHHVLTSSLPETAGWQARTSRAKAGRLGDRRFLQLLFFPVFPHTFPSWENLQSGTSYFHTSKKYFPLPRTLSIH